MDYNTSRTKMTMPEYGRNVQKMVNHMLSLENRTERTECAHAIIQLMGTMFPGLNTTEYRQKLWDHITIMSDFNLDIDAPFELPTRDKIYQKPDSIPYPEERIRVRHYGKSVEKMIEYIISIQDADERKYMSKLLANQMKKSFLTFNKDVVNDAKILDDLRRLSDGLLDYSDKDIRLMDNKQVAKPVKKKRTPNKKK